MANTPVATSPQGQLRTSLLAEYKKLTDMEAEIKGRKEEIKKYFVSFFEETGLSETPEYQSLVGKWEERVSYSLNSERLERSLPSSVFRQIVKKEVVLDLAHDKFLKGEIPLNCLLEAEVVSATKAFSVRKVSTAPEGAPARKGPYLEKSLKVKGRGMKN